MTVDRVPGLSAGPGRSERFPSPHPRPCPATGSPAMTVDLVPGPVRRTRSVREVPEPSPKTMPRDRVPGHDRGPGPRTCPRTRSLREVPSFDLHVQKRRRGLGALESLDVRVAHRDHVAAAIAVESHRPDGLAPLQ